MHVAILSLLNVVFFKDMCNGVYNWAQRRKKIHEIWYSTSCHSFGPEIATKKIYLKLEAFAVFV